MFQSVVDNMSPHTCYSCGRALVKKENVICILCNDDLPRTEFHHHRTNPFIDKFFGRIAIQAAAAYLYFSKRGTAQRIIHELKYKGRRSLGVDVGRQFAYELLESKVFHDLDRIVPIPLHNKRHRSRGYNQSEAFAEGLSEILEVHLDTSSVIRSRATTTQTRKTRVERFANVDGAFEVSTPHQLVGKKILLVDDVLTTGATMEGCAQELLKVPGVQLYMATIGFAYFQ